MRFGRRGLGIEHWVDTVLPWAVERTAAGAGAGVHMTGWSLGGIFTMFTAAAHPELPIASAAAVATPFDLHAVPILAVARPLNRAGVRIVHSTYRLAGGIPAPLTRLGFPALGDRQVPHQPIAMLALADDRDFLAQLEAVDRFMSNLYAYPGRTSAALPRGDAHQ